MNKQLKKARELTELMFDTEVYLSKEKRDRPKAWYYITRNRETEMLLSFDRNGKPIWCPHDLQYTIPHMFNSGQKANKRLKEVGGHKVIMSRYQVIDGVSVWSKA